MSMEQCKNDEIHSQLDNEALSRVRDKLHLISAIMSACEFGNIELFKFKQFVLIVRAPVLCVGSSQPFGALISYK
jgi:hypothetical protein